MPTWSEPPLKALWTASTISQTLSMPLTASLVNRPSSSMLSCARSPPIWSHCVPNAANLALENVAQKTINYLPNLVKKCASHHTETSRRINPKCALSSCHSEQHQSVKCLTQWSGRGLRVGQMCERVPWELGRSSCLLFYETRKGTTLVEQRPGTPDLT